MNIPPDAAVAFDQRLTAIRLIGDLSDHADELKTAVKKSLKEKNQLYAQSRFCLGKLVTWRKTAVDVRKLHALVGSGKITLDAFLSVATVRKEPLAQYLGRADIEAISEPFGGDEPSLFSEFRQGIEPNVPALAKGLVDALRQQIEE